MRDEPWQNFSELTSEVNERLSDISFHTYKKSVIRSWLSQANREFARRSEIVRKTQKRPLVAGQMLYRLPPDCFKVSAVIVTNPGFTGEESLPYEREEKFLDGTSRISTNGRPYAWYLKHDRREIGLMNVPSSGGFEGVSIAVAGDSVTLDGPTTMSDTDDFYNTFLVRILSGDQQGEERTISDYDGTNHRITVSVAFSGAIQDDVQFEVYPDSLRIEYIANGNSYGLLPTPATVDLATSPVYPADRSQTRIALTGIETKEENYYTGVDIKFTSGDNDGERVRVLTSTSSGVAANFAVFTFDPGLPNLPVDGDAFTMTEVPNIPTAYHDALVEWCVFKALEKEKNPEAGAHLGSFLGLVQEAIESDRPAQALQFEQIREHGRREEGWW